MTVSIRPTGIALSELARLLPGASVRGEAHVRDVTHDSRQAAPGTLFCAIRGATTDGHDHAPQAADNGAAALLVERWLDVDAPQVRVGDVRAAAGEAAAIVHGRPSAQMAVVGITGTNGKTTTAYLVEAAMAAAGWSTGLVGTVESRIDGEAVPGVRTTPEGPDLQRLLADMARRGVDGVAIEVSSHGLRLHRVAGLDVRVGVFTNLSQDHLDFHTDMDDYADAKALLFTPERSQSAVIDVDGDWGPRMAARSGVPTTTVGDAGVVRRTFVHVGLDGTTVRLDGPTEALGRPGPVDVTTRLVGDFNGRNASDAYLAAVAAGVPAEAALAGIAACPGAPGRLEPVDVGQDVRVLVDYAHTPDAVRTVIATLRPLLDPGARLLVVLGAGGDRDAGKRGPMGAAAAAADVAVLTSDNPRSEDPATILAAVEAGARGVGGTAEVMVEVDRRQAIATALDRARGSDVVLIAGKGHEVGQQFADHTVDFDDRRVAAELLVAARHRVEGAA